jgi:hypothetical protein
VVPSKRRKLFTSLHGTTFPQDANLHQIAIAKDLTQSLSVFLKVLLHILLTNSLLPDPSALAVCSLSLAGIEGSNPVGVIDDCCECCVLSGRGLCDGAITRPE